MEAKKIEVLYRLMEEAREQKDDEGAAALQWAIFELEQKHKVTL